MMETDYLNEIFLGVSSSMVVQKIRKTGNSGLKKQGNRKLCCKKYENIEDSIVLRWTKIASLHPISYPNPSLSSITMININMTKPAFQL